METGQYFRSKRQTEKKEEDEKNFQHPFFFLTKEPLSLSLSVPISPLTPPTTTTTTTTTTRFKKKEARLRPTPIPFARRRRRRTKTTRSRTSESRGFFFPRGIRFFQHHLKSKREIFIFPRETLTRGDRTREKKNNALRMNGERNLLLL